MSEQKKKDSFKNWLAFQQKFQYVIVGSVGLFCFLFLTAHFDIPHKHDISNLAFFIDKMPNRRPTPNLEKPRSFVGMLRNVL